MPQTIARLITSLAEYPPDTVVRFVDSVLVLDAPDGSPAAKVTIEQAAKPSTPEETTQVRQALLDAQLQVAYWITRSGQLQAALRDTEEVGA
jgi:hypothetical protein